MAEKAVLKAKREVSPNLQPHLIKKGQVLNPNGRPKGSVNERTKGWELLKETITTGLTDKFMEEMDKLDGIQYINAYLATMEYFKPKLSRSEVLSQNENIETITVTLGQTLTVFPDNVDEVEAEEISCLHPTDEPNESQA